MGKFPEYFEGPQGKVFKPITDRINAIIDELDKIKNATVKGDLEWAYSDTNLIISNTATGAIIPEMPATQSASVTVSPGEPHAFKPFITGSSIAIRRGYINTIEVTGADGYTEWSTGSPYLYWIELDVDPLGAAVGAFVDRGTSLPSDSTSTAYIPIFNINATGSVTSQHVRSSLNYAQCAGYHQVGGM